MNAVELVCFHHAGGGATSFNRLRLDLLAVAAPVSLTRVELPGRGARRDQARIVDAIACARSVVEELADVLSRPHVLLGHSMGALLAYLVARQSITFRLRAPEAVIVAAAFPPHLYEDSYGLDTIDDHDLALELASHGGLPAAVLAYPEWIELVMPTVRDDLRLCQSYNCPDAVPLPCPLHIFGGYNDPLVSPNALAEWTEYSDQPQPIQFFAGDHFLFRQSNPKLASAVADIARNVLEALELTS